MFVYCDYRVLSHRGHCDELITRLEESYRVRRARVCVCVGMYVCNLETSRMRRPCWAAASGRGKIVTISDHCCVALYWSEEFRCGNREFFVYCNFYL